MNAEAGVALPRWKCHKEVSADKITEIFENPSGPVVPDHTGWNYRLEGGGVVTETRKLIARARPAVGDYIVVYRDGYVSWSPGKEFEDGYTRMEA